MSQEKPSLNAAIRHLAERERSTEHATPRELTAYHEGSLPTEAEARVRQHLALCRHCSDLLLDLAGFATLAPPAGVPELTDAEVEEDWQALKAKLAAERREVEEQAAAVLPFRAPVTAPSPEAPSRRKARLWAQAAALVVAGGLGLLCGLNLTPRSTVEGGAINVLDTTPTRGGLSEEDLDLFPGNVAITVQSYAKDEYALFEGRILQGEREVWRTSFKGNSSPSGSFVIPGGTLPAGRYLAKTYGRLANDPGEHLISEKPFEINAL